MVYTILGITYGHTGHVRFLTIVENPAPQKPPAKPTHTLKSKTLSRRSTNSDKMVKQTETTQNNKESLIISGGDGYEDFRSSSMTEDAGREDSTNHLLLWRVWTNYTAYRLSMFQYAPGMESSGKELLKNVLKYTCDDFIHCLISIFCLSLRSLILSQVFVDLMFQLFKKNVDMNKF